MTIVVYTDGACSGNPGPGGWAWAVAPSGQPQGSGGESPSTNQRMEIRAVLEALKALEDRGYRPGDIEVVSDSTYVVNCFRDRWYVRWQANGWKNSQRKPVANVDLWKPLIALVEEVKPRFRWVKGHSGDRMNDLVDALAVAAATTARSPSPAVPRAAPAPETPREPLREARPETSSATAPEPPATLF